MTPFSSVTGGIRHNFESIRLVPNEEEGMTRFYSLKNIIFNLLVR